MIHTELCKKINFYHMKNSYMLNLESVPEVETYKLLWDFEIQKDHLISARRLDRVKIDKKRRIWRIVDFVVPAGHRVELKRAKREISI